MQAIARHIFRELYHFSESYLCLGCKVYIMLQPVFSNDSDEVGFLTFRINYATAALMTVAEAMQD
jgi:hypothetical protein